MEGENSRKRKANWEEEEQENSLCEEKQENITQEEIDKLSTSLLQNLKDDREKVTKYMSQWMMMKTYEDKKKERIDTSLVDFLQLHVQLNTYFEALEDGYIQLDESRGYLPLDQSTKEEIVNEAKLWEGFGYQCTTARHAYADTFNSVVTPKIEAYCCKLNKIEGVVDKLCNDITLEHLVLNNILYNLDIVRERYDEDDASAATADFTEEMYEDLKKELVDLLKDNFWFDIADDLRLLSQSAHTIASRLTNLFVWNDILV